MQKWHLLYHPEESPSPLQREESFHASPDVKGRETYPSHTLLYQFQGEKKKKKVRIGDFHKH